MALSNFYLTDKGSTLLARAQTGTALTFTGCQVCEGLMPDGTTYADITELPAPVKNMEISKMEVGGGQAKIVVQFSNSGVGRPFQWTGYGLWAADPDYPEDRSKDILYGTAFAANAAESLPVPAALTEFRFNVILTVQRAASVTALIDSSLVYATTEDLDAVARAAAGMAETAKQEAIETAATNASTLAAAAEKAAKNASRPSTWTPTADETGAIPSEQKGQASGVATLGADGKVPANQLPRMFYAGPSAPENTNVLWIDTTEDTGGLKYHNGTGWVTVPVRYS